MENNEFCNDLLKKIKGAAGGLGKYSVHPELKMSADIKNSDGEDKLKVSANADTFASAALIISAILGFFIMLADARRRRDNAVKTKTELKILKKQLKTKNKK